MKSPTTDSHPVAQSTISDRPSIQAIIAAVAFVCAAWILSGGCGLLGRSFAAGLTWCALLVIGLSLSPNRRARLRTWLIFALGLLVAILTTASANDVTRLAGLAVCAAILSTLDRDTLSQRTLCLTAQAIALLALYRFALTSIPLVWHISESIAAAIGNTASTFWGRPISVGPTFAGLDHLVLMAVLILGWANLLERPRVRPVLLAVSAVVIGHAVYLLVLSFAVDLAGAIPATPIQLPQERYVPPDWFWGDAVKAWLPWNIPVAAVVWHSLVLAAMLHLAPYRLEESPEAERLPLPSQTGWRAWAPVAVAVLLPVVSMLSLGKSDLNEKTILVFDRGYLDWDVPAHGRYGAESSGRFGMLPTFVRSLGGKLQHSTELTPEELSQADVLLLIHPNQPWSDETIARVHDYIRQGGALLVAAGPRLQDSTAASSYNDLLDPLGMPVRFDTAVSENEAWRHGIQTDHPAALGLGDDRDRFGMGAAASIQLPWRASPILVGRWGWSDPGSDFFLTGLARWDANERLGDLVLAAERRLGAGRVVVLGDNACLTNQGNVRSYRFTGRLLAYLANRSGSPQAWWRHVLALGLLAALVFFWAGPIRTEVLAVSVLAFLLATSVTTVLSCRSWEVYPDGQRSTPNNVAYIDASHLETCAESPWKPDGIDGLALTLMRNGFLVLAADDLSGKRLRRAGMLVSIAPSRSFAIRERTRIQQFVENGGVFISMAGATDARKANQVLRQFGFHVPVAYRRPGSKQADAIPFGSLYRPYPDYEASLAPVVFHAAWPVGMNRYHNATSVVSGTEETDRSGAPIVAISSVGQGVAIVIGDTAFALNKTLENVDGSTLAGNRMNAHFWRWLIGQLPGREPWLPPTYDWDAASFETLSKPAGTEENQP